MRQLNPIYLNGLREQMIRIEARQSLRFILGIQAAMADSSDQDAKQAKINMVMQAFPEDEAVQATLIEALSRG